jgi:hypothetical protein
MRFLLHDINEIVEKYYTKVNFLFVYILEAHAKDEWPIKELEEEILQHKSIEDRLVAAKSFISEYSFHPKIQIVADNEDNVFIDQYPSWPFRYWGFQDGRIRVKCMPDGDQVSLDALNTWLVNM